MDSRPLQAYVVCATPRSGSTLLCEMLRETGVAGQPREHFEILRHSSLPRQPREYFRGVQTPRLLELLAPLQPGRPSDEPPEQWSARILAEGSTQNGVWGGKLMWGHVEDFLSRARELPGLADADLETALDELLGNPQLIFVTRRDKIGQAVSLWRALQTQSWRADDDGDGASADSAIYDFDGIDTLVTQLASNERAWSEWLAGASLRQIRVTYEQLDAEPRQTVAGVLHELGLAGAPVTVPRLSRQRDELSSDWAERYRKQRERAASGSGAEQVAKLALTPAPGEGPRPGRRDPPRRS